MNDYDLLYKKIDAQDKIINTQIIELNKLQEAKDSLQKDYQEAVDKINNQALEIARLKEENEKLKLENKVLKEQMVAMVKPNYTYGVR